MGIQRRHSDCFDSGQPRGGLISQNTATQRAALCIAACSTRRHSDWAASDSRSNSIPGNQADIRFPLWCGVVGLPKGFHKEKRGLKYFVKTKSFLSTPNHTTAQHGLLCSGARGARVCGHLISDFPEYGNPACSRVQLDTGSQGAGIRFSVWSCGVVWSDLVKVFPMRERLVIFGVIFILY